MMREAARAVRLQGIERTIEENYFARALARALGLDKIEAGDQGAARAAREDRISGSALQAPRWRNTSIAGSRRSTTSSGATCAMEREKRDISRAKSSGSTSSPTRVSTI